MNLYVYPTDRDWFDFLRSRPDLDEVNFWRPGGEQSFRQLSPGDLLLFRLKSPINKIGGGGVYVHFSIYPVGLAWEAFDVKNGAPNERAFDERIARYKGFRGADALPQDTRIGCIILQAPFFLPEELWIDVPRDYPRNSTQGMRFDAALGSGRVLFAAVKQAMQLQQPARVAEASRSTEMFGDPVLVKRRLGQGAFRVVVTDNFERRCAVTGEKTLPVLEAAHILPVKKGGQHRSDNGLLLRSDLHTLFDLGYVTVTPDYTVAVSPALRDQWSNGRVYYDTVGRSIRLPTALSDRPSKEFLEWHRDTVFRA